MTSDQPSYEYVAWVPAPVEEGGTVSEKKACVDRLIGHIPARGDLWVKQHEWRQWRMVRINDFAPAGYYCIYCLAFVKEGDQ